MKFQSRLIVVGLFKPSKFETIKLLDFVFQA